MILTKSTTNFAFTEFQCDVDLALEQQPELSTESRTLKTLYDKYIYPQLPDKQHLFAYIMNGIIFVGAMWSTGPKDFA